MIAAIVPAAGLSARMGRPKPLLDVAGTPLLARVIAALAEGGVGVVVVVAPPSCRVESAEIARIARQAGAVVVIPEHETIDMRATIEVGLDRVESLGLPDSILLCPTDTPGIRSELVRRVIDQSRLRPEAIVVPISGSKRGHPISLPWPVATEIRRLKAGTGVKSLLDDSARAVVEVVCSDRLEDIDTPEEYRLWIERSET